MAIGVPVTRNVKGELMTSISESVEDEKRRRLFFAIWPDTHVRHEISSRAEELCANVGGRRIVAQNLHITLHFLGDTSAEQQDCYSIAAASMQARAFRLQLDHFGYFRGPRIFWMGVRHEELLLQLHADLGSALDSCGYHAEHRRYTPHVSLARRCRRSCKPRAAFTIDWPVDSFSLIESVQTGEGVEYRLVESYPLRQS